MIRVHLGRVDSLDVPGAVIVRQPDDYLVARLAIRQVLGQLDASLDICVLTRICDDWFWDLQGIPGVWLQREDPVTVLRERLNLPALPPALDDPGLIQRLGLLHLAPPGRGTDATAWALSALLDTAWGEDIPSYDHLTRLVAWFAEHEAPVELRLLIATRLHSWEELAQGALRDAYAGLQQDSARIVLFLCCWIALGTYNVDLRRRWLEEEGWYRHEWQKLAEKMGRLPLPARAERILSAKLEAYWNGQFAELKQQGQP